MKHEFTAYMPEVKLESVERERDELKRQLAEANAELDMMTELMRKQNAAFAELRDDWVPEELPRLVKTCPRCEGCGLISHPAWIYWHERNKDKNPEEWDSFPDVPEEVPCPECHGQGKILTKIGKQVAEVVEIVLAIRGLR